MKTKSHCKRAKAGKNAPGFTLIEVLIAISLLSVLLGVTFVAANVFMAGRKKGQIIVNQRWHELRNHSLMKTVIENTYDYYVKSKSGTSSFSETTIQPFFHGHENRLEFVTLSSIYERDRAAVVNLRFEKNSGDAGGRLLYQEASLKNRLLEQENEKVKYDRELVLISGLKQVRMRYYGLQGRQWNSSSMEFDAIYGWSPTYSGKSKGVIPEQVELNLTFKDSGSRERQLFQLPHNNTSKKIAFSEQEGRQSD